MSHFQIYFWRQLSQDIFATKGAGVASYHQPGCNAGVETVSLNLLMSLGRGQLHTGRTPCGSTLDAFPSPAESVIGS